MNNVEKFSGTLANVQILTPREKEKGKKIAQAIYTKQVVTIVGVKTTTGRFLPVSHAGYSNETYVDKVDLLNKTRAEFIGRKLKGIERRAHMALFREMVEHHQQEQKKDELKDKPEEEQKTILTNFKPDWRSFFSEKFGKDCTIPEGLCIACWNCSLFGGLEAGKGATFSRIRYFDTFSVEDAAECIQTDDSPEQMAIGNTVGEDLSVERGEASFHRYEYVKPGTRFPFITIIESPTLLDVAGYLAAVKLADQHGYGKYSANHGKFETHFLAVSTGYPLFSVLNMLAWLEGGDLSNPQEKLKFETLTNEPISLFGDEISDVQKKLGEELKNYLTALDTAQQDGGAKTRERRSK
ncbi:MAG TPA: type I-D CRISPR-associated protein Cas7/Csc2 [Methylomirabilota bacterium]|nr:type I-D CRISPR-associated protein Cas7/Csc2 [Methylomirabilota bacterium]